MWLLLLSACWSLKTADMRAAAELEGSDPEKAEAAWFASLDADLTYAEWAHARERACALRIQRLQPVVEGLDTVTAERAAELRAELAPCLESHELLTRLTILEEQRAVAALEARERTDERAYLLAALPHLGFLSDGHALREGFAKDAAAWRDAHLAQAATSPPITSALHTQLAAKAGHDGPVAPDTAAAPLLKPSFAVRWSEDASCAGFAPTWQRPAPSDGPFALDIALSDCADRVETGSWEETYTVVEYASEWREEEKCETTRVTTATPVTNYHCDTSGLNCIAVGSYTDYDTQTYTNCWTENVEYKVPYEVQKTRTVNVARRILGGRLALRTVTPHGESTTSAAKAHTEVGQRTSATPVPPEAGASQAAALQSWLSEARSQGTAAITRFVGQAEHTAGQDRTDESAAREHLLAAHLAGIPLSDDEQAFVARPFGLPFAALVARDWPDLVLPPPFTPRVAPLYHRTPREAGIVRDGFPTSTFTVGAVGQRAEALESQPKREGAGAFVNLRASASLVSGFDHRGFGVHGWLDTSFHAGARVSKPWQFPNAPDAPEFPALLGLDAQLGLALGARGRNLALFGGLAPMTSRHILGGQTSRGLAFPFVVYAEIRIVQRYPILASAWGYGLRTQRSASRGVRVDLPVSRGVWFTPRLEERRLRTVIHGLDPEDPVDAGFRTLTIGSVGLTFEL